MAEERSPEQRQQRLWLYLGLAGAAAAFIYVFWKRAQGSGQQTADTTASGGLAPGYGTQLGDLIQFTPGAQGGSSGGPGGIAGGASGSQIGSVSDSAPVSTTLRPAGPGIIGARTAPAPRPAQFLPAGPGGLTTAPMASIQRAPAPAPAPAPQPTVPRQTVSTVIQSGLRAQGGSGTSVSQAIGILGAGSVSPSRVATAPISGSVPPRNLPAGVSVNNARRLGL